MTGTERQHETIERDASSVIGRVEALERRFNEPPQGPPLPCPPFHHSGTLTVSESGEWPTIYGGNLIRVVATLSTAGSTSTVATVRRTGVALVTITFAAGVVYFDTGAGYAFTAADTLSVEITTAGTGATDLVVQPLMRAAS